MNRFLVVFLGLVMGLAFVSSSVSAGPQDYKILKGKVHVEKDSKGAITAISVKPAAGAAVQVVVDDVSKTMAAIDGHGAFVTGNYTDGGTFKVSTWIMQRQNE